MGHSAYREIVEALTQSREPLLIVCHVSPDGDAVGAALALAQLCEEIGRPCAVVNDDRVSSRYDFLPGFSRFRQTAEVRERYREAVALDCADIQRLGRAVDLFEPDVRLINVDHHETNNSFGSLNLVEPEASATCLVLYRLLRSAGLPISHPVALSLYTGIVFDTGGFRYNNTTPEIHYAAADLLTRGIEPFLVADRVLEAMTREQVELVRLGLATLTVHPSGRIAYASVDQEMLAKSGADEDDSDALLLYTRALSGVEVGVLFRERKDGSVKASLRSREKVDVASLALRFSGGGHMRAAGCNLEGPLDQAVKRLMSAVEEAVAAVYAEGAGRDTGDV